ncbi:MAG TPA: rod shape-determining protein MreC [Dyella sp.]|uniref:rod shape-determining protein MreC n=1 Tax=Dyella sp. TaxID=1869338 RepID=UPI002BC7D2F1|nr:rod shape-determining protein MreC [Dyella sp.]HUB89794.1 rod shape-determining protein MreC [Dyella sp.]
MPLAREESSPLFAGTAAGTLRLIFYLALAMVLMVLDHRNGWLWRLRYATAIVVEPVYRLASLPAEGFHTLSVAFADRRLLTEQNQRLREDLLLANAKLNRMAAVAEQNQRLKELLDTQHSLDLHVQMARVIGMDLGAYRHRLMINLGARDGIKAGQPLIDAHGLVGQIVDVLPNSAMVMLVTDPDHAVPVMIQRTGLRTIAYGSRNGQQLTLPNVPMAADVQVGDKLLTSGLGGRFPQGFPVGEISSVGPSPGGMFLEAHAQPSADLDRADELLVLHDLPEPAGPPAPVQPAGPPDSEAPAPASTSASPRASLPAAPTSSAKPAAVVSAGTPST